MNGSAQATIYLHPPKYPPKFEPFACKHPIEMQISDTSIEWNKVGGGDITVDHARCLGCGAPVGTGRKRNIFVDIACLLDLEPFSAGAIHNRLIEMRDIYLRRALVLFGAEGWKGDKSWQELAEIIDPNLTMRAKYIGEHADGTQFAQVFVDEDNWPSRESGLAG